MNAASDAIADEILAYKPLSADNAVSSNPQIPSVSASAVLGESESVSGCVSALAAARRASCTDMMLSLQLFCETRSSIMM